MKSVLTRNLSFISTLILSLFLASTAQGASFSVQEKTSSYSPYWVSGFTRADYALKLYDLGGGRASSYSFITLNRSRGPGKKFAIRIPFILSSGGWDQYGDRDPTYHKPDFFFEDPILSIVDGSLILLPGDIQVYWEGRFYVPVGQQSRLENRIARFRNDFIFSKNLTRKIEINWVSKTNYYLQSGTTYYTDIPLNEETGERGKYLSNTREWRFENWFDLWYKIDYDYGIGMQVKARSDVYHQAPEQGKRYKHSTLEYAIGPQFRFDAGDLGNMILSVANTVDKSNTANLLKMSKETTNFTLLAFYSF